MTKHVPIVPFPANVPVNNAPPDYHPLPSGPNVIANDDNEESIANIALGHSPTGIVELCTMI